MCRRMTSSNRLNCMAKSAFGSYRCIVPNAHVSSKTFFFKTRNDVILFYAFLSITVGRNCVVLWHFLCFPSKESGYTDFRWS